MTRERLVTEYTAETRGFRRGADYYDKRMGQHERLTNDRLTRIDRRWERSARSILTTRTALVGLTGYMGGAALGQVRAYAESWRDVERRLTSIGVTSKSAGKDLVDLAIRTRSAVGGTAAAVQRFSKSTGDGIEITSRRVETLQKLLGSAGATGSERASVSLQLGQALQSGVLSGDEFRSIRENAPVEFLDALAKAAGITRKELKAFAEDQMLTTEVVLTALDSLAVTADQKFGALAVSGSEAFDVLNSGLVAYVGQVDGALGATASINGAMVSLGEYMSNSGEGAETMAESLRIVGRVSLAVAGSRGLGALSAAFQRSAENARASHQLAQREVAASRVKVDAARAELVASNALLKSRQTDLILRQTAGRKTVQIEKRVEVAKRKNAQATVALAGAEAHAVVASDRLTAAQTRLTFAARLAASSLGAAKAVLAFFGGPLGLAITALAALPVLLSDVNDKMADAKGASDAAKNALNRYAEAAKRAGQEQESMGGKITAATKTMVAQSRVELQDALRELQDKRLEMSNELRGVGFFDGSEITGPLNILEQELHRLYGQYGNDNVFLSGAIQALKDLQAGTGDIQQISEALNVFRAVGNEAFAVYDQFIAAVKDGSGIEGARDRLLSYAKATGRFTDVLAEIDTASGPVNLDLAFQKLALQIFDAAQATDVFGKASVASVGDAVKALAEMKLEADLARARLEGNTAEAERLEAMLVAATGQAEAFGSTNMSAPITAAADEAVRLAKNLAKARAEAFAELVHKVSGGNADIFDPRNESGNSGRIFRKRGVPTQNRTGYVAPKVRRSGGGGGGGAGRNDEADAERNLAQARGLLLQNGQKALYIEQQLTAARERMGEVLPSLINLGLSRADAEAVIQSELQRTQAELAKTQTAEERRAAAFAKNALQDIKSADNLGDAIGRIGDRLLDLALDPVFDALAGSFANLATGGGGGGIFGQIFGALFSANGNAFGKAGLTPFARGGVVDRPTLFQYGGGKNGVMGEAGPEAILPLSRGRDGRLGVVAELPTLPSAPVGAMQANSQFNWTGDMVIQSDSDNPQEVGREVTDQMRGMFGQMFGKQLGDAMRSGGSLDQRYQRKAGH